MLHKIKPIFLMEKSEKIEIYDNTLRDGTQQSGLNLSLEEKILITKK